MSNVSLSACLKQATAWVKTDRAEFPYTADINGQTWLIRVNDFPEEPLYTLLIENQEIGSFDDWSPVWFK